MMYSFRIEQAIRAAAILHKDHVREGRVPYPYITHLFAVACILADYTDDEDIIIAGLLHDTIEDTDYTFPELEGDFGREVRDIVEGVTEPPPEATDSESPWVERSWKANHQRYIAQLKQAPVASIMVAAADKIHNMRSVVEEYYDDHARFNQDFGGTLDERLAGYQAISNIINTRLESDIVREFNHVFDQYKDFIYAAQERIETKNAKG